MPRNNSYPRHLARLDPLVTEHVKLPTSVVELLTIAGVQEQRYKSDIIRRVLTEWSSQYRKDLGAEYTHLVRQARDQAPARTLAATKRPSKES